MTVSQIKSTCSKTPTPWTLLTCKASYFVDLLHQCLLVVSPVVISVPLEGSWWDCHRFAAQDGCLTQMGWHVFHVCDHGRVCQKKKNNKTKQKE